MTVCGYERRTDTIIIRDVSGKRGKMEKRRVIDCRGMLDRKITSSQSGLTPTKKQ